MQLGLDSLNIRQYNPNMVIHSTNLEEIFRALDRQIGAQGGHPLGLVICGGSALAALGLLNRTTKDVDVLRTAVQKAGRISVRRIREFPPWLASAAQKVARDFELPAEWLNLGPAGQIDSGLPEAFQGRLTFKEYGEYLTVYFTSRFDQIHFKLYAAVDRDDYHVQDLFGLDPTDTELERAAQWVLTQDVSEAFRTSLKEFLRLNGRADVAKRI